MTKRFILYIEHIIVNNFFKVFNMASRPAIVLVVLIVAIIAFCFAGVFAAMTGTYHINFNFGNNTTDSGFFGNLSQFNSEGSNSKSSSSVQTYTDNSSSGSSSGGSSSSGGGESGGSSSSGGGESGGSSSSGGGESGGSSSGGGESGGSGN